MAKAKKSASATISTSTLTAEVAAKYDAIPKKMTKEILFSFLTAIEDGVAAGNKVRIDKLGIMQMKDRAARKGRNPQTGEEIKIPASKKVAFRVASSLKERVGIKKKKATTTKKKK
jgi:DNA-binding protein HU-beta